MCHLRPMVCTVFAQRINLPDCVYLATECVSHTCDSDLVFFEIDLISKTVLFGSIM